MVGVHLQVSTLQAFQALQGLEHGLGTHVCRPQVSSCISIDSPSFLGAYPLMLLVIVSVSNLWILSYVAVFSLELMCFFWSPFLCASPRGCWFLPLCCCLCSSLPPLSGYFWALGFCPWCLWEFPGVNTLVQLFSGSAAAPGDLQEYSSEAGAASCGASLVNVIGSRFHDHWCLPVIACAPADPQGYFTRLGWSSAAPSTSWVFWEASSPPQACVGCLGRRPGGFLVLAAFLWRGGFPSVDWGFSAFPSPGRLLV